MSDFESFRRLWDKAPDQPAEARLRAAFEVYQRRDLGSRSDSVTAGAVVLLQDAANALQQASLMLYEDDATTPDVLHMVKTAIEVARDAHLLAAVNPRTEPTPATIGRDSDGTIWREPRKGGD